MEQDIRWKQRFSNYVKALNKLSEAVIYINSISENEDREQKESILSPLRQPLIKKGYKKHPVQSKGRY